MSEKPIEISHFRFLPYSQEAELAPARAARAAQEGKVRETAPTEAVGCTIYGGQEAIVAILDYRVAA